MRFLFIALGAITVLGAAGTAWFFLVREKGPENLSDLLITHTETGVVMTEDEDNLAPLGTLYEIRYWQDGTFDYTSHTLVRTGYYSVSGSTLCRSFNPLAVRDNCVQVFKRDGGGYEARTPATDDVRYSFLLE
ncbi:hypothetical protein [Aquisalinus flavus]|uniref:Uncharacterized protein n=1 Tax=Aquisalinus flavus TaxID=1526572 RepID=A0A8J2V2R0_9PROT|nr:hypothetical protein [Aquisalinus flavus]MBD0426621.1 hypothetical protein [Aquisalinus flavus]UNE47835.1 hypothetical protein FF099_07115 [Aquisalinus flavus]GGD06410.1 hypothetical protein GCM10011342_14120 [Aquisalinus flavus]